VLVLLSVVVITTRRKTNVTAASADSRGLAGAAAQPDTRS